ncbi:MAG: MBL fold metallo-hydrolase [Eubacteriales bacterium]
MQLHEIKERNFLFTFAPDPSWNLNLHLIRGKQFDYIIDTGLGSLSVKPILDLIKKDSKNIIVINTHYHWDHIWANHIFKNNIIISHTKCRDMMEAQWDYMIHKNEDYLQGKTIKTLPNLVFDNEINFPEDHIRVFYTPGHTIDSISILDEEEKVLHAGDNIGDTLEEIIPSIDTDNITFKNTLIQYQGLDFDTCVSGHNQILPKDIIYTMLKKL